MGSSAGSAVRAYVANRLDDTVSVIDRAAGAVVATVPVGDAPSSVAVAPDGAAAYVSNADSGTVSVIDTATNTVANSISVGVAPSAIAITPDGAAAYVVESGSEAVSVIDVVAGAVVATIPVGVAPSGITIDATGGSAYVTNGGSDTVSVIDVATRAVVATVPVGAAPYGAASVAGGAVYVTNTGSNEVSVIDAATNTLISTVPVGVAPLGVAVGPTGTTAYVVNSGDSTVSVIEVPGGTVTATIPVGASPTDVAVSPDGTVAYVTESVGAVSVVDPATNTAVSSISVGASPADVAFGTTVTPPLDPPNVVVIMTDDQTLESMRVLPSVQALIGDAGVRFDENIVTDALCCPSRATFLSGQYAFHHQVLTNDPPSGGYSAFDHSNALPVWLQEAGYRTIHLGKYFNHYSDEPPEVIPPGWDDWQAMYINGYFEYSIADNGMLVSYGSEPEEYSTDVLGARAVQAIQESSAGGPFFLNLAPFAPHTTAEGVAVPAPRHAGSYASEPLWRSPAFNESDVSDKPAHMQNLQTLKPSAITEITGDYHAMLESLLAVDELVQSVMNALVDSGELDNTVVVFTSDNGFEFGDHRIKSGKGRPYEESVQVPLMIRGPGFPAGTTVDALTANIDLAPTIAGITGAVPLRQVDGVDLRSLLQDPGSYADRAVLLEGYNSSPKTPCYLGVRTAHAAYWTFDDSEELYDLDVDPYELDSLHADPNRTALRDDLVARLADLGPRTNPCQATSPVVSVGDVSVAEPTSGGTAIASVSVRLDLARDYPLYLPYAVTLGTASNGDAAASFGSVVMGTGKTTATIKVKIKADVLTEPAETVLVSLLPPPDATYTVPRPTGTVTILDRGALESAMVAVGDVTVVETHAVGTGSVVVTVTLSRTLSEPTPVAYVLSDGDALRGTDYVQASGTVIIPPNKLWASITVKVTPDVYEEATESFFVTITPPVGIDADRGVGTITILDDDYDP